MSKSQKGKNGNGKSSETHEADDPLGLMALRVGLRDLRKDGYRIDVIDDSIRGRVIVSIWGLEAVETNQGTGRIQVRAKRARDASPVGAINVVKEV